MINWCAILYEAVKLLLQFAGALFIAWKAVQWALGRYKREKLWERKLQAYSDVLSSLGSLQQILGSFEHNIAYGVRRSEDPPTEIRSRYWMARRNLEESRALAAFLLPDEAGEAIQSLIASLSRLNKMNENFSSLAVDGELSAVKKARGQIVDIGKKDLGLREI